MTSLADLQARFWRLITAADGARHAGISDEEIARDFRGDDRLSGPERMELYGNMYFFRILDVMQKTYPRVMEAVGEDEFHNLVTGYLLAHPSTDPSIDLIGRHFAECLRAQGHDAKHVTLAEIEWVRAWLVTAPDEEAMPPEALTQDATLRVLAAHRVIEGTLLWRAGYAVRERAVDETEQMALALLARPMSLPDFCAAFMDHTGEEPEVATPRIFALLGRWVSERILVF